MSTYALCATPDQVASLASFIIHEWGDYGYTIEGLESPNTVVTLAHVRHFDGSRVIVAGDRYGNCRPVDPSKGWRDLVAEMTVHATRI